MTDKFMILANLIAIVRKEFQSYFYTPFAYVIASFFWLISGFFFNAILEQLTQDISFLEQSGQVSRSIDVASQFLEAFSGIIISLFLVLLPALSMGLYSEERRQGTLELLATSPVNNWVVASGKLLGVISLLSVLMVPIWIWETIVFSAANPPVSLQIILLTHLSLFLISTAILSLGMFLSSLTDSSILSYILTFILILFLWIIDLIANSINEPFSSILSHLSLFDSYDNLVRGILEPSSLVLFASYIFIGIFLTAQSIEIFRFQRT